MNEAAMSKCRVLVESHDLVGLEKMFEDPNISYCLYPCHIQPGLHKTMREYMIENKSVVEKACMLGHFDIVEMFLHKGCSANLPTSKGRLIHSVLIAVQGDRRLVNSGAALELIKLMLTMDCDVNVKSFDGKSPFMMASEISDPGIMKELINYCLDWQIVGDNRCFWLSPLHMVCMNGSVECLKLLLSRLHISDLYLGDLSNNTPMSCSLLVLKNNQSLHSSDIVRERALLRVQHSHMAIIELIIQASRIPIRLQKSGYPSFPGKLRALELALDIANKYEDENHISSSSVGVKSKLITPYSQLVRMLTDYCNIDSILISELTFWKIKYPSITSLLNEIEDHVVERSMCQNRTPRLMDIARQMIRVCTAKCDNLDQLEHLPLPRKLVDFVKFIDF